MAIVEAIPILLRHSNLGTSLQTRWKGQFLNGTWYTVNQLVWSCAGDIHWWRRHETWRLAPFFVPYQTTEAFGKYRTLFTLASEVPTLDKLPDFHGYVENPTELDLAMNRQAEQPVVIFYAFLLMFIFRDKYLGQLYASQQEKEIFSFFCAIVNGLLHDQCNFSSLGNMKMGPSPGFVSATCVWSADCCLSPNLCSLRNFLGWKSDYSMKIFGSEIK